MVKLLLKEEFFEWLSFWCSNFGDTAFQQNCNSKCCSGALGGNKQFPFAGNVTSQAAYKNIQVGASLACISSLSCSFLQMAHQCGKYEYGAPTGSFIVLAFFAAHVYLLILFHQFPWSALMWLYQLNRFGNECSDLVEYRWIISR